MPPFGLLWPEGGAACTGGNAKERRAVSSRAVLNLRLPSPKGLVANRNHIGGFTMGTLAIITTVFSAPVGWNIAIGCFVLAATCMALNYHQRMREIQQQNNQLIALLRKIDISTQAQHTS
jgi:hypothetical protein